MMLQDDDYDGDEDPVQTVHVRRRHLLRDSFRCLRRSSFDTTKKIKVQELMLLQSVIIVAMSAADMHVGGIPS